MIANDRFISAFGAVAAGDTELLVQIVANAVRQGFAIVLSKPGTKVPVCTLNARERNAADRERQALAQSVGDERWAIRRHDCGIHHALTVASLTGTPEAPDGDPAKVRTKVQALIKRVTKENGGVHPNIGVELGRSRLIAVDVDTAAEAAGFESDWRENTSDPMPGMTVRSPGLMKTEEDGEETWVHKDGGHYWFEIPDGVELPPAQGAFTAESGWVAMWADHQVLVPPSHRPEGAYELIGQMYKAPKWLIGEIRTAVAARMERAQKRSVLPDGTGDVDRWSASLPWADLLGPDGWTDTGKPDRCSCPIWTAPGVHGSPKSATAHDVGCDRYDVSIGHGPLHVWTSNPPEWLKVPGQTTFSKVQYLAYRDHEGNARAVLVEHGFVAGDSEFPGFSGEELFSALDMAIEEKVKTSDPFDTAGSEGGDEDEEDDEPVEEVKELTRAEAIRSLMLSSEQLDGIEDPEYLIEDYFDLDTIARVIGKSGHGKTFVTLDMSAHVALGKVWHGKRVRQSLVVYMVAEGAKGFKLRLRAWEQTYNDGKPIPAENMLILPVPIQSTSEDWRHLRLVLQALAPGMVIIDTQARVTVGVKENDATEMGIFVERLEQIRRETHACVIAVHHMGHDAEHGRGSTAMLGALGSEIIVKKTAKGELSVATSKQKDQEESEPVPFILESVELAGYARPSAIVKPNGWIPVDPEADPFDVPVQTLPTRTDREFTDARDMLAAIIWTYFHHDGVTRANAVSLLSGSNHKGQAHTEFGRKSRAASHKAWDRLIGANVLVQVSVNGKLTQRYMLKGEEAVRLGLPAPADERRLPDGSNPERPGERHTAAPETGTAGPVSPAEEGDEGDENDSQEEAS
jgi:RecA-family ATPase